MIERWDLTSNCNLPSMTTCEGGEFVLYEDHVKVVNHLLEALEYALSDLSDLEYAEKDCTLEGQRMYAINPFVIERVRNSIAAAISRARGEQP